MFDFEKLPLFLLHLLIFALMSNITSFEILDEKIQKVSGKPTVLEALWDGDTQGWFLCLYLYSESGTIEKPATSRHYLGEITLGTDIRVFSGGAWTEAYLAKELGEKAIEKYNLIFYFPSSDHPDDDCPAWTERYRAINCLDCNKLIIPTTSEFLPKDICYHCHLERERKKQIKDDVPFDDGVNFYFSKEGNYKRISYCSFFESFTIAPFVGEKIIGKLKNNCINEITLTAQDILELMNNMTVVLDKKLTNYSRPDTNHPHFKRLRITSLEYKGKEYELADRFHNDHDEIRNLIYEVKLCQQAINEKYEYKFYIKRGDSHRDDNFLRYIHYTCNGTTNIPDITYHYNDILNDIEVKNTLNKLFALECINIEDEIISVTQLGKNII